MIAILADANVEGHVARLVSLMQSDDWREIWDFLGLKVVSFTELGLDPETPDDEVWQVCQDRQLCLLTSNRNDDGPDSLAATIRSRTTVDSLPVFTFGDADRILQDRDYALRVVESLFDQLLRLDTLRGTGRQYLP